ncbi:MAG: hypothetical protein E7583_05920 [Ruminococcaceae bacterium]|nr:hypothetical protein [Oscillospiraceae bacterium]
MKKIRVMAVAALTAIALQLSCSAASVLFNIPTVLSIDEYAHEQGRSVEDVLANVRESAEAQKKEEQQKPAQTPEVAPIVKPVGPAMTNPNADQSLSGEQVSFILVNGLPQIFIK